MVPAIFYSMLLALTLASAASALPSGAPGRGARVNWKAFYGGRNQNSGGLEASVEDVDESILKGIHDLLYGLPDHCDLGQARLPLSTEPFIKALHAGNAYVLLAPPSPLPSPSQGLQLAHVAIGRGTQNYTCKSNSASEKPKSAGAVASLFNVSCIAATSSSTLSTLPNLALQYLDNKSSISLLGLDRVLSGQHYFTLSGTPFFDLSSSSHDYGRVGVKVRDRTSAPEGAPKGRDGTGWGSVGWLKLEADTDMMASGTNDTFEEVFRVNTAGGMPPDDCSGVDGAFEVEYAAEYWFYSQDRSQDCLID